MQIKQIALQIHQCHLRITGLRLVLKLSLLVLLVGLWIKEVVGGKTLLMASVEIFQDTLGLWSLRVFLFNTITGIGYEQIE